MNDALKATVQGVVPKGKHGPFAVATSEKIQGGSITFSLEPTVWKEKDWPEEGSVVLLWNLRMKRLGWRAKQGRFYRLSDEQTERNLPMTTPILASAALKPIFEARPDTLIRLGLEDAVLGPIMSHLTKTYTDAAEFELAVKAARVMGNIDDYRVVFRAMKSSEAAAAYYKNYHLHDDFVFLLMQVGTEAELRKQAEHDDDRVAIGILRQLKDVAGLMELGRKLEDKYFAPRAEKQSWGLSPEYFVGDAVSAYKAAAELGDERMPQELMRFGDKLKEKDGVRARYASHSTDDLGHGAQRLPLVEAYEASGTSEGFRKAAMVCIELSNHKEVEIDREKNCYLMRAAEAFIKAGDFVQALVIASQLAARKDIASAIKITLKTPQKVDFALLEQYALRAIQEATGPVKKAILEYLKQHENQLPFLEHYTYWSDSMSNDSWGSCVSKVNHIAGRFDVSLVHARMGTPIFGSIAKHLYASDKAEVIEKVNSALMRHLFVGWMLSGISYELQYGSHDGSRKYEHPSYAAWRTFNEIGRQVRETALGLPSDALVTELHVYLKSIQEEWFKLMPKGEHGNECSQGSEKFLVGKLPEMQTRAKAVYDAIAKEIEGLVAQL